MTDGTRKELAEVGIDSNFYLGVRSVLDEKGKDRVSSVSVIVEKAILGDFISYLAALKYEKIFYIRFQYSLIKHAPAFTIFKTWDEQDLHNTSRADIDVSGVGNYALGLRSLSLDHMISRYSDIFLRAFSASSIINTV